MPWKAVKSGNGYDVIKKGSGEVVAHHPNEAAANSQVRALYANYNGEGKKKVKKTRTAKHQGLKAAASRRMDKKSKKGNKKYPTNNNLRDNDHDYR
jgi:hypothetical protein